MTFSCSQLADSAPAAVLLLGREQGHSQACSLLLFLFVVRVPLSDSRNAGTGRGCPGAKKNEFLTSVLDALSTDMVHAVSDPASPSRLSEPDPSHTLEERVVHWYFKLLDKNASGDIGKKEMKPFKRFLRKKSKPKKCVKKFVEYCDVNDDRSISLQELMGCLGVAREEGRTPAKRRPVETWEPGE
ncbi:SPARC-related modular calcium-binding protein 2 [Camelus dromedarius]|uniref:SPARC-related modular calcium-binding protein 2 n=1 Tax=Camelus dromedarius TaxID=9838 RepID=A0A5N4DWM0_CAMDR|nr:SPARC-related modular calcium-binding protein 2 [Camelus dromedarius]